jgi:hypothetical protein
MTIRTKINSSLIKAGNGIYYITDLSIQLPKTLNIKGKKYYGFCDFILIPTRIDKLSKKQVVTVNSIREKYIDIHPQFSKNNNIRKLFKAIIKEFKPKTILEIGPGKNPLNTIRENTYLADFDKGTIDFLKNRGENCQFFGKNSTLRIPDNSIELIFAIFVFQFDISSKQINELSRTISSKGILVANIYKRSEQSKRALLKQFHRAGFKHASFQISELFNGHEFWIFFKSISKNKLESIKGILNLNP